MKSMVLAEVVEKEVVEQEVLGKRKDLESGFCNEGKTFSKAVVRTAVSSRRPCDIQITLLSAVQEIV